MPGGSRRLATSASSLAPRQAIGERAGTAGMSRSKRSSLALGVAVRSFLLSGGPSALLLAAICVGFTGHPLHGRQVSWSANAATSPGVGR
jgi:hypothetical protein